MFDNYVSSSLLIESSIRCFGTLVLASGLIATCFFLRRMDICRPKWLRWSPTSPEALEKAESKLYSYLKRPFNLRFVKIPSWNEEEVLEIHTLSMNTEKKNRTPLVMIHGYASGTGLFVLNLDNLSEHRPLYAFDIPGFGRSSRPQFSKDTKDVEKEFTQSIESWREQMGLKRFVLLGHSFGGYLAALYALRYPEKVRHLILADPWGIPPLKEATKKFALSFYGKILFALGDPFYPIGALRVAGPLGPQLLKKVVRSEMMEGFSSTIRDTRTVLDYIYHINAQAPTGEKAFNALTVGFGLVKEPMLPRIVRLPSWVPITFIYGSKSFIDNRAGTIVKGARKNSYVDVKLIYGAGHNLHAEKSDEFNSIVNSVCDATDAVFAN